MSDIDRLRQMIKIEYTRLLNEDEYIANTDPINDVLGYLNSIYKTKGKLENIREYGDDYVLKSKDRVMTVKQDKQNLTPIKEKFNARFKEPDFSHIKMSFFPHGQNSHKNDMDSKTEFNNQSNFFSSTPKIPTFGTSNKYPTYQSNTIPTLNSGLFPNTLDDQYFQDLSKNKSIFPNLLSENTTKDDATENKGNQFEEWDLTANIDSDLFHSSKFTHSFNIPTVAKGSLLKPDFVENVSKSPPKNLSGFDWNSSEINTSQNHSVYKVFDSLDQNQNKTTENSFNRYLSNMDDDYANLNDSESDQESDYDYGSDQESYSSEEWAQKPDEN